MPETNASKRFVTARSNFQTFVLALCVLALFAAQTFGVQRGYVCVCSGHAVVTQATHCHGPHGSHCHEPGSDASGSHSEEGQGSREDHAALKGDLPLRSAQGASQVVIAPMVLLATLPLLEVLLAPPAINAPVPARVVEESLLPFGVTVARTVVLLI